MINNGARPRSFPGGRDERGFRPGMSLLDMAGALNAGRVGRYDAGHGGPPGAVRDTAEQQREGHKAKAAAPLGALGGDPVVASG